MMNFYQQPPYGMIANPQQAQMPKTGNWLTAEKYALLQKGLSQFKLSVTEEELAKGQCNHYYNNGTCALVPDIDGSGMCTCAICGTKFATAEFSEQDVKNATQNILDILNTIKIMYLSIDANAALEYFQIIPFIEKIPQLYNIAVNDFKRYEGVDSFTPANQQNPFNVFSMMTTPGYGMGGYCQQPMYGAPQQQAGFNPQQAGQQPMMMNGYAQQNPGFNPMYGAPPQQPGYQPNMQGFAMNPMGAAGVYNTNMPPVQQQGQPQVMQTPQQPVVDPNATAAKTTEFKK